MGPPQTPALFSLMLGGRPGGPNKEAELTCLRNCFTCVQLSVTLWTIACQSPLSLGFSRQGYWSGLPRPLPGDLPDPRIEPMSLMSPESGGRVLYH